MCEIALTFAPSVPGTGFSSCPNEGMNTSYGLRCIIMIQLHLHQGTVYIAHLVQTGKSRNSNITSMILIFYVTKSTAEEQNPGENISILVMLTPLDKPLQSSGSR